MAARARLLPSASEVGEALACGVDLALLALKARVGAFVVAADQQDDAVAVCVAEDAQQDALPAGLGTGWLAEAAQDLGGVVPQTEFE
jgi:hypothetical protein